MKLIGLTGGPGSGKSTVATMLHDLGAEVIDADNAAHAAYEPGTPGFDAVVREFGQEFVRDGRIDRARLGELVFSDTEARHRLNAIVHPLVRAVTQRFVQEQAAKGARVILLDIPLLYETRSTGRCDFVLVVSAPPRLQRERVMRRAGMSARRFGEILRAQLPDSEKRRRADFVVLSALSKAATFRQLRAIVEQLRYGKVPRRRGLARRRRGR